MTSNWRNRYKKLSVSLMLMLSVLMLIVSCAQEESEDTIGQQVDRFTNVYGLAYNPKIPHDLYLGTRYGLVRMNAQREWSYTSEREHRHGLLSFTFLDQDTMISSGHPAVESDFEDPLGLIISTDLGETWEPLALQGEVDFHVMEVNATDSSVIYGLDAFGKGLHRSQNHGEDWVALEAAGFTETYPDFIFSLVSDPGNPNALLAGTQQGVFSSDDGGETWELIDTTYTMLSAKGVPDQPGTIVAYTLGATFGMMLSEDFGETWSSLHLQLEDDEVLEIAVHPEDTGTYAVGTLNEDIFETKDGGVTWKQLARAGEPLAEE